MDWRVQPTSQASGWWQVHVLRHDHEVWQSLPHLLLRYCWRLDLRGSHGLTWYFKFIKKHVEIFSIFWGCEIYAYDHTIKAPPRRGKNIKYFETGLGTGSSQLKTLKDLITQNNHTADIIEYLKVINIQYSSCPPLSAPLILTGNFKKQFFCCNETNFRLFLTTW